MFESVDMTVDNALFDEISKKVKDTMTPEFDQIFRTSAFDFHNEQLDYKEMIKKMILIRFLFNNDFFHFLKGGQNPLK